jgi:threonine dehydratase
MIRRTMTRAYSQPTREDVEAAARRIRPVALHTPMVRSDWLSDAAKASVWLKLEIVQTTGAFKIRGALNAILRLRDERPEIRQVVTASAGNHGQAIALAAARTGIRARIHVPANAPATKLDAIKRWGAEIVPAASYDEAEARASAEAADPSVVHISAYNHPDVIAGAGTVALEMFEDEPDLDTVVVPLGGGGLLSGTAIVARSLGGPVLVIGAEVEASPVFTTSLGAGRITTVRVLPTLADGLAGNMEPDSQTFGFVQELVDRVVLVSESALGNAMRELVACERFIVEGAGATGVAAILQGGLDLTGRRVGVVLSGRNVDVQHKPGVFLRNP